MPQTLTDEQVAALRKQLDEGARAKQVSDMVEAIYNDPTLGVEARALIKKKFPDLPIPDYDVEQKVTARLDAERKEREDAAKKQREAEEDERYKSQRKRTQEEYGFTDAAMSEVEKLMTEKNIGDYDVAAQYFASKQPQPTNDRGDQGRYWNHGQGETFKEISADPEEWARKQILQAARNDEQRLRQQKY